MDIVNKKKMTHLKATPLGNPSMGMPNLLSILPGMTDMATMIMNKEIQKLDFPPVDEFLETIHDAGGHLYGCKMAMDMMKLTKNDLYEGVDEVIRAMDFMEKSEGGQIIFI